MTPRTRPIRGTLVISGPGLPDVEARVLHRETYVNGAAYAGMEDNDIRGYLDGVFLYGWNQPGQSWVRLGRIGWLHRYGEYEMFRFIQRWENIRTPSVGRLADAELVLETGPKPPSQAVSVALYAVHKDWNPGAGGIDRDNVSPPGEGEVWWNERAHGKAPWGLPGCSFPSDDPELGDIGLMPLDIVHVPEEGGTLRFSSPALTAHIARQLADDKPLLFLFKLTDEDEDRRDTLVHIWSGNEGDSFGSGRKPQLHLAWESEPGHGTVQIPILLEHGRTVSLPGIDLPGPGCLVGFLPEGDSPNPVVYTRSAESPWQRLQGVGLRGEGPLKMRVGGLLSPMAFGEPFVATLVDTWVQTGPPEKQRVEVRVTSPSGRERIVVPEYKGDCTWTFRIRPDEVGRWTYEWSHSFAEPPYRSCVEVFDVVVESMDHVARLLAAFEERLAHATAKDLKRSPELKQEFSRIVRSVMATMTPETVRSVEGQVILERLRRVRGLFGEPVPDPIPLERAEKRSWELGVLKQRTGRD